MTASNLRQGPHQGAWKSSTTGRRSRRARSSASRRNSGAPGDGSSTLGRAVTLSGVGRRRRALKPVLSIVRLSLRTLVSVLSKQIETRLVAWSQVILLVACVPSRAAVTSSGQPIQVAPEAVFIMPRTSKVTVPSGQRPPASATHGKRSSKASARGRVARNRGLLRSSLSQPRRPLPGKEAAVASPAWPTRARKGPDPREGIRPGTDPGPAGRAQTSRNSLRCASGLGGKKTRGAFEPSMRRQPREAAVSFPDSRRDVGSWLGATTDAYALVGEGGGDTARGQETPRVDQNLNS